MFAEKPRTELMDLLKKNKDFKPVIILPNEVPKTILGAVKDVAKEALKDYFKPKSIVFDNCNVVVTTELTEFRFRNPLCATEQKPPEPPPPTPTSFYVGDKCNCGISVTFAFYERNSSLNAGAGIAECFFNGNECPLSLKFQPQSGSSEGDNARSRFEPYDQNITIRFKLPYSVNNDGQATGDGITVFYCTFTYSHEEILANNGFVDISVLPKYHLFVFHPETATFTNSYVDAPWDIVDFNCIGCEPNNWIYPPPHPPPPKDKCCMCCEDNKNQNNDALLKLVLKRIGSLPASVPDNFTKQHPSMINIESLAELMLWQMQQIDALLGAYPIELKIEDNDLTKEGNQEEKISLPNMSEAIAELLGLLITVKRDTHATLITAIKAMGEAGMAKNLGVKTLDVTLANAEYLGYKLEQKKKEVPSLFTPGGKDITETLIEKNVEIITYENTDKKDLQDDLKFLKTMAARWNAQNWRQVTGDPVESLKQSLFGNPEAIGETHKKNEQGDFNDFTEQAERGFIEVSGITDSINPWGRPYSQRPKIREIGTEKGNYGNDGKETVS
ncbi:MAG: hypothetical protein V7L13_09515 [Nostoc sp.]|uniref:hypothetical protein n=1 Tax=Nostoc sp. TaxID=1180 RepID=UPI002FFB2F03